MTLPLIHLSTNELSVLIDPSTGCPTVLHWGEPIKGPVNDDAIRSALQPPITNGNLDAVAPISLLPEHGSGYSGRPGIEGHRTSGAGWAPRFTLESAEQFGSDSAHPGSSRAVVVSLDVEAGLKLITEFEVLDSGVLRTKISVHNAADTSYHLSALRQTLPLPSSTQETMTFGGRWSREFIEIRQPLVTGSVTVENRAGRTSHNRVPIIFAGTQGFTNDFGAVRAAHLEWSGNSFVAADALSDGRRCLQVGELLFPGEVVLAAGEHYESPWVCWAFSSGGLNGVSERFHRELRSRPNHPKTSRPVTLNIWEAVYFDHRIEPIEQLADAAASIGVERFVIDDGWFHLRRDDHAGLGDWWVDPTVWPHGLGPIAQHVTSLGMQFGLWFEPEMVNPNSDLYRAHPEWVLTDHHYEPVMGRQQLVLDLGRSEVRDYLFEHMSALLTEYPISYVKWDHNRELVHASDAQGRAGVHHQTLGFYDLLARLRSAHPTVEIESCSSGGGRIDFKVLQYTHRFWTSDCIDPLERQHIQRGYSYVFPPEYMGSHIGSGRSHTTRRQHSLAFRAATALFGHFGIEWNLLHATDDERKSLAEVIEFYKRHRDLLHRGVARRFDHSNPAVIAHGVIAADQSEAMVSFATVTASSSLIIEPMKISGLNPKRLYQVSVENLAGGVTGPSRHKPSWVESGVTLSGEELELFGLQPPAMDPEQAMLIRLVAQS